MTRKQNLSILVGLLILALAAVLGAVPADEAIDADARMNGPRPVRVARVELSDGSRRVPVPGVTRAARRSTLSFAVPARMAERLVDVGDRVAPGQILARLDASEYTLAHRSATAALTEIEVRLAQARRDEERTERLVAAKAATSEELEAVTAAKASLAAARDAASAQADETRRLVTESVLRAPFAGTVTAASAQPGEWIGPGDAVFEISGRGAIEVEVEVPESVSRRIAAGSDVELRLPMSGRVVPARVKSVSDATTGAGALFPVIIETSAPEVTAGQTVEVVLGLQGEEELMIPLAAVIDSGSSRPSVFRIDGDGVARRIAITPGRLVGDRLSVSSTDLQAGDVVAVLGHTALADGDVVEVR